MGEHPLVAYARGRDDVIITPHIGGCTRESMEKTELHLAQRLVDLLSVDRGAIAMMSPAPATAGVEDR